MAKQGSLSLRLVLSTIINIAVVYLLTKLIPGEFEVTGGIQAMIVVGILVMIFNAVLRPILSIVTFPLKLFANLIAIIIVNGAILYAVLKITQLMDPSLITLTIGGGFGGWIVASIAFGFLNWLLKHLLS